MLSILLFGCKKEPKPEEPIHTKSGSVIILCEGLFGNANSRIDLYNKNNKELVENVFFKANNRALGDVAQSIIEYNNELFVVVNNSGKIERLNKDNFKSISILQGLQSPRYILPTNNVLYVSDLYADKIHVVSYPAFQVIQSISIDGWVEEMIELNNYVYASNYENPYIYVIDKNTHSKVDSIYTVESPYSIALDKNNKIWALTGNSGNTNALVKVSTQTKAIESSFSVSSNGALKLRADVKKENLYYLAGSKVYKMAINAAQADVFADVTGANWYGLEIDPETNNIWICNAKSFVEQGSVHIYSEEGTALETIATGIIPNDIVFLP